MEFRFVSASTWDRAYEATLELSAAEPEDFNDIIIRHLVENFGDVLVDFEEEDFVAHTLTLEELREEGVARWILNDIALMEVGQVSEPVELDGHEFLVFIVDSKESIPVNLVREEFREQHILQQQYREFSALVMQWREAADIQFNERGINSA